MQSHGLMCLFPYRTNPEELHREIRGSKADSFYSAFRVMSRTAPGSAIKDLMSYSDVFDNPLFGVSSLAGRIPSFGLAPSPVSNLPATDALTDRIRAGSGRLRWAIPPTQSTGPEPRASEPRARFATACYAAAV